MLVGRERERQVIARWSPAARVGESGTLVLTGEAGIGKSALLEDAASAVGDAGMRVLRAAGVDAEQEVPFGGLLQLLRPVLEHLDALPAPQAEALGSALALLPGSGGERFAVGAAVLSLLSRVAEDRPLAVLVDDAHLLDPPSAQALCFAARRLTADPVVVLLAARDETVGGPLGRAPRARRWTAWRRPTRSRWRGPRAPAVRRGARAAARGGRRQPAGPARADRRGVRRPATGRTGARPRLPGSDVRSPSRRPVRRTPGRR